MKKVQKLLDTPVKSEDNYRSTTNIYVGDSSSRNGSRSRNPNQSLRTQQVCEVAQMLLEQISRFERISGSQAHYYELSSIQEAFIDISIIFSELDSAMLFTETEKNGQRLQAKTHPFRTGPETQHSTSELSLHRRQVENWLRERTARQRKVDRIDTTIDDLGVNVNDVRCSQILRERKQAIAALETTVTEGVRLLKDVNRELKGT